MGGEKVRKNGLSSTAFLLALSTDGTDEGKGKKERFCVPFSCMHSIDYWTILFLFCFTCRYFYFTFFYPTIGRCDASAFAFSFFPC